MLNFLTSAFVAGIGRAVLIGLGIGAMSYVGFDALLTQAVNSFKASITGMPLMVLQLAGLAKMDIAANIIFSAFSVRIAMIPLKRLRIL